MNRITRSLLIAILISTIMSLIQRLRQGYIQKLSSILYVDHNPDLYLKEMYSLSGRIFLNDRDRQLLSIDALLVQNDIETASIILEKLENSMLSNVNRLTLYQKQITFYLETHNNSKAIESFEKLEKTAEKLRHPQMHLLIEECRILIHVYAKKDGSYAEVLEKRADFIKEDMVKGICLYRAGVSYYNINDEENCRRLLNEAQKYLKDTMFAKIIAQILTVDFALIEKKIM